MARCFLPSHYLLRLSSPLSKTFSFCAVTMVIPQWLKLGWNRPKINKEKYLSSLFHLGSPVSMTKRHCAICTNDITYRSFYKVTFNLCCKQGHPDTSFGNEIAYMSSQNWIHWTKCMCKQLTQKLVCACCWVRTTHHIWLRLNMDYLLLLILIQMSTQTEKG